MQELAHLVGWSGARRRGLAFPSGDTPEEVPSRAVRTMGSHAPHSVQLVGRFASDRPTPARHEAEPEGRARRPSWVMLGVGGTVGYIGMARLVLKSGVLTQVQTAVPELRTDDTGSDEAEAERKRILQRIEAASAPYPATIDLLGKIVIPFVVAVIGAVVVIVVKHSGGWTGSLPRRCCSIRLVQPRSHACGRRLACCCTVGGRAAGSRGRSCHRPRERRCGRR